MVKRCLMTIGFAVLAASAVFAQGTDSTAPAKPADNGPSLGVTMGFIQEKLNDIGPVNYLLYIHDALHGNDSTIGTKYQITNVWGCANREHVSRHTAKNESGCSRRQRMARVFGALEFWMLAAGDTPSKKLFESYQIFALTALPGAKVRAHSRSLPLVALQG